MATPLNASIERLTPHDRPMLLLDEMVAHEPQQSTFLAHIRPGAVFMEAQGVPAHVGIEYMAQAIAAHGGSRDFQQGLPAKVGFLLGTPSLNSRVAFFKVGLTLRIEVRADWGDEELLRFCCRIYDDAGGELLQDAGLNVFQPRDVEAYLAAAQKVEQT